MRFTKIIFLLLFVTLLSLYQCSCNFITHQTISSESSYDSITGTIEPNYNTSLDFDYQDFVSYLYIGNRVENFTGYFNTFYKANDDYNLAFDEYRASLISFFNRKLDSLSVTVPVSGGVKEKLDKAIERASKIIQFHKNSKFIDESVLIIGKSYFLLTDYYKAERTFNEFLSKFSSSVLADEAILYLGRTEVKLGKIDEGEKIFKNLVQNSSDREIQSLAARDLGILEYNNGNPENAVNYFRESIEFSNDKERKAEGQFILAKILSFYKPEQAASEYKKVLDYTSEYDLSFFAQLNYAKGLIYNKNFATADEELEDLRKDYRDEPSYTQLVDLEMGNNLYAQNKYPEAMEKYYEVIVKYPNTPSSSDAYYYIASYEEDINHDYLKALVNYRKATEESSSSDFYKESSSRSATLDRYFTLQGEVNATEKIDIPTANANVERFRAFYNEEKGINQPPPVEGNKDGTNQSGDENRGGDENPGGDVPKANGKPGGFKNSHPISKRDSNENPVVIPETPMENVKGEEQNETQVPDNKNQIEGETPNNTQPPPDRKQNNEGDKSKEDVTKSNTDTTTEANDSLPRINKENEIFNAYYEIAEIFIYSLNQNDSAEYYLKLLLDKFTESDKRSKVLYTLGNFYKNNGNKEQADATFERIISMYPNTVYANESRKILGIQTQTDGLTETPIDEIFKDALNSFNQKKYPEAITKLQEVESKFPTDTLVAKSLYSIGWIYENELVNKDSSIFYFKKLKEKFPDSEYTLKVDPILQYVASLEPDSTKTATENPNTQDSTAANIKGEENKKEEVTSETKEENTEVVKPDTTNVNKENRLSQEEIDKLLKESDEGK